MLSRLNTHLPPLNYKSITICAVSVCIATVLISKALRSQEAKAKVIHFQNIAKKKRELRDQQIKDLILPHQDITPTLKEKILNSDATTLLNMLRSQEVTSEQILVTYFQRAITIGLDLQLIGEILFDEALEQARECDRLRKENPSACQGLLFGLPMTVKDAFILKNTDSSAGIAAKLFNPAQEDGLIVKTLKEEGAIIYLKSNAPQTLFSFNTVNQTWGQARNPWDRLRIPGGSSGGEAGLLAARCSPLGIGNDIGGSVRIPSLCCGTVGFRPTLGRVTYAGSIKISTTMDFTPGVKLTAGPMTKTVRDANLLMRVLLNSKAHTKASILERDPDYLRKEWEDELVVKAEISKKLRIGYYKSSDLSPVAPAGQRAVEEAVRALQNKGHELVEVIIPNIQEILEVFLDLMFADGKARVISDALEGEAPIDDLSTLIKYMKPKSASDYVDLMARRADLKREFLKMWEKNKLDALLSPGIPGSALRIGYTKGVTAYVTYTAVFNALNLPTGVVPITLVKEGEDMYPKKITQYHEDEYNLLVKTIEGSVGLPTGVQVSTLTWEDEKCVGIMLQLEEEVGFNKKYKYPI